MKSKKIEFATNHSCMPPLKPAKNFVPKWYKDIKVPKSNSFINDEPEKNVKSCVPFLDSFMSGYMVELWTEIYVEEKDSGPYLRWAAIPQPIEFRDGSGSPIPVPEGHHEDHLVWKNKHTMQLPKGYSLLITHPLNRFDLPFTTLSAVVDADELMTEGNIPFFLKKGFSGIIEIGTPLFQVIPFKRDSWIAEENTSLVQKDLDKTLEYRRAFRNSYKKLSWHKKEYN